MSLLVRRRIGMLTAIALIVPPAVALSASPAFACTGGLWQNVRYVDGVTWLGWNTEPSTPPGGVGQVNTATIEMYSYPLTFVSNTNADGILVNYQFDTGNASWSGWDTLGAPPGTALWTTMAGEPNSGLDMIAATTSGLFFNDVFPGPRGWQEIAQPPVDLQNIGFYPVMTGMSNGDMVTMIGAPEGLVYADVRYASGGWSGWSQVPNVPRGVMYDLAITGDQNDEVQVVALAANDGTDILYHTVWSGPPSGTWQGWDEPPSPPTSITPGS